VTPSDIQRAFRHVPGHFLILAPDAAFTIVGASDSYLGITHTDQSIFGRPLFEVFPANPLDTQATGVKSLEASLRQVIASSAPDTMPTVRYDLRRPESEGGEFQERYWQTVNVPVLAEDGRVEYIVHRIDDARAPSKRDAVEILESITEGFFTLDRQWRFDYVNREAHRILGREPGSLSGQVLWEVYPGLEGTDFDTCYRRTMHERKRSSFTAFYAGDARWYQVTCFPAPEGISVYFRDVTEERQAQAEHDRLEARAERQRRMYETALNSTPDLIYVFDLQHRIIYANEALLRMWGVTEADAYGRKLPELGYEPWHVEMHDREIEQVIASRAPIRGEVPFSGTNGRRIYDYIFAPVLGPAGEVVAVAGTTRDVTERQAAEQAVREQAARLTESDRAKDEFLATLSHELRNPLAPLRNSFEVLRRTPGVDPKVAAVHSMMERQVNQLVRLVDDLLEMSRISRGTLSLRRERVPLEAMVRNAVEANAPLAEASHHTLTVELPAEPLWLEGDPVRLAQILANLLNNAARYTDDGGRIAVRARREDGEVVISVRDNGIGIGADVMPRMFEMFSRGHRETGKHQGGLGIGLALSRRLAQMHDGSLQAHSDGPGHGSEFIVRLPLADPPASSLEPVVTAPAAILSKTRVLVVDDNHDAGDSLGQVLDMLGAEVRVARDGAEGIEAFASHRPSVVLLDIGMPGLNGYDVARAIRTRFPEHPAKLVALTGWGQDDDRRKAREAGFDHHLVKPAEIESLQKLLTALEGGAPEARR
jgi:PAS domain S-box-containing protein